MGELVVRLVGGVHALFGLGLFAAGLSGDEPGTLPGWVAIVLGGALVATMVLAGLRLGLGEPVPASRATVIVAATLIAGFTGAILMQLPR